MNNIAPKPPGPFDQPKGWMHYGPGIGTVTVCAWCPGKEESEAICASYDWQVSHGICDKCAEQVRQEMRCTRVDEPQPQREAFALILQ